MYSEMYTITDYTFEQPIKLLVQWACVKVRHFGFGSADLTNTLGNVPCLTFVVH